VLENLELGLLAAFGLGRAERRRRIARVLDLFPRLAERRSQAGRTLSGGEQQMLAVGRALVGAPRLLLVDEPSEGLAPMIVAEIFEALKRLRAEKIALLLVEQNVQRAAAISDSCYVMEKGRIVAQGKPDILDDEAVRRSLSV
jgi:branched-chain amino acid transport system ATP-binding protein